MNKYKTNRGRVVFVTLSFSIIAGLMILSANNNNVPEQNNNETWEKNEAVTDPDIIDEINDYGLDIDVVVEAKAKELAVQKYLKENKNNLAEILIC